MYFHFENALQTISILCYDKEMSRYIMCATTTTTTTTTIGAMVLPVLCLCRYVG